MFFPCPRRGIVIGESNEVGYHAHRDYSLSSKTHMEEQATDPRGGDVPIRGEYLHPSGGSFGVSQMLHHLSQLSMIHPGHREGLPGDERRHLWQCHLSPPLRKGKWVS